MVEGGMFRLQFSPKKDAWDTDVKYVHRVYAYKKEDMVLFMKQHNFNIKNAYIEFIENFDDNEDRIIEPFLFKSNKAPELYRIMTTRFFVDRAIETTAYELSDSLLFGPAIIRRDIQFIDLINDLINKLKHVYILDYTMMDGDLLGSYTTDLSYMVVKKDMEDDTMMDLDMLDDSEIYDSLWRESTVPEGIQPITIEAYVHAFSEIIIQSERFYDEYEKG